MNCKFNKFSFFLFGVHMSYHNSELFEKAKSWNVPFETPRSIRGKFGIIKAAPGFAIIGIVFLPIGIFMGILFYSLGIMDDYLVDDWKPASAKPLRWINSTGERINNRYVPGIEVEYRINDNQSIISVVKITKFDYVSNYRSEYDKGNEINIEYSESKPNIAKIEGFSASAIPVFIALFPLIFFIAGVILMLIAFNLRSKVRMVLENGQFAVGTITKKRKSNKHNKHGSSTNRNIIITFEYSADGEEITAKAYISTKIAESVNVEQEIPVIYTSFGMKFKAYSPLLLKVEFNN